MNSDELWLKKGRKYQERGFFDFQKKFFNTSFSNLFYFGK